MSHTILQIQLPRLVVLSSQPGNGVCLGIVTVWESEMLLRCFWWWRRWHVCKTPMGCALTGSWDQQIERFGPDRGLNRASNRNLSAQIHLWNSFQSGFLLLSSPKTKPGRAVLTSSPAQSSAVQHPDNHSTPWNRNIHIPRVYFLLSNSLIQTQKKNYKNWQT